MKALSFLILASTIAITANSQVPQTFPDMRSDSPLWVELMYAPNANVHAVRLAYESYYTSHEFVKNNDTQFYKRWMRANMHRTDKNGNALTNLTAADDHHWAQQKSSFPPGSSWEELGPWQYDHEAALSFDVQSPGAAHVYTVEQAPSNHLIVYAGTANAGLWKSVDKGLSWNLMTRDMGVNSVYSIAVDPLNADLVYFGEGNGKIWKSVDGGLNWSMTGNAAFQSTNHWVRDLNISPSNSLELLAATNTGLYRSINGGATWATIVAGEFMEIERQPGSSSVVYAVKLNASSTSFYRSTNGGASFALSGSGWPTPVAGDEQKRCEISVSPANPNLVYVLASGFADGFGGLYGIYVSYDAGLTFAYQCCGTGPGGVPTPITNPNTLGWSGDGSGDGGQYYYDLALGASPTNADKLFSAGISVWRSEDAGISWDLNAHWVTWAGTYTHDRYTHADVHDIKFFQSPTGWDMWVASDGGLFYSSDEGDHMEPRMYGIQGTDFWGFQAGYQDGDVMLGGTYHNGTLIKYKDIYKYGATSTEEGGWLAEGAGDNIRGFVNFGDNKVAYDDGGSFEFSEDRLIRPANRAFDGNYKCNTHYWTGEYGNFEWDPFCYNTFYSPVGNKLYKTEDGGLTWAEIYAFAGEKIIQVKLAPSNSNVIYVTEALGYWDHIVWRSDDAGLNWVNITPSSGVTGDNSWRHKYLDVDTYDDQLLWCILIGNQSGNKVFRSANGGASWTNYTGPSAIVNEELVSIVHQLGTDGGLYVGTHHGVFYRNASMSDWEAYSTDLPAAISCYFLQPFYGGGKIRAAGNRGVHQCDFYQTSSPLARISAETRTLNIGSSCQDQFIQFADYSVLLVNENTTWNWSFEGGIPAISSDRNPLIQYTAAGDYNVSLTVTDDNGTHTVTMDDFVTIANDKEEFPLLEDFEASFPPEKWSLYNPGTSPWEWGWIPGDEANNKVASYPNYWVDASGMTTQLLLPAMDFSNAVEPEFSFEFTHRTYSSYIDGLAIQYRLSGDTQWQTLWQRLDPLLNVSGTDIWWWYEASSTVVWQPLTIDLSFLEGESCVEFAITNIGGYGNHTWVDNVSITSKPLAEFQTDMSTTCLADAIQLTDLSFHSPDAWLWTISPATYSFSGGTNASSQNPEIQFSAVGTYTISLTVNNAYGSNSTVKTDFVTVNNCNCPGDFNGDLVVNTQDFLILLSNLQCTGPSCLGDMDENEIINTVDLLVLLSVYGTSCAG
jgi:PKD repeat protein